MPRKRKVADDSESTRTPSDADDASYIWEVVAIDEDTEAKGRLFQKVRQHIKSLMEKAGDHNCYLSWPVSRHLKPLGILPEQPLATKKLNEITWHTIPPQCWQELCTEEMEKLKKDVWYYARTALVTDVCKATMIFMEEIERRRTDLANSFGVAFAFNERTSLSLSFSDRISARASTRFQGGQWMKVIGSDANAASLNLGVTYALTGALTRRNRRAR